MHTSTVPQSLEQRQSDALFQLDNFIAAIEANIIPLPEHLRDDYVQHIEWQKLRVRTGTTPESNLKDVEAFIARFLENNTPKAGQ